MKQRFRKPWKSMMTMWFFWKHLTISTMPASVALNLVRSCCDSACPYTWTSTWNYLGEHPLRTLDAFHAFNAPLEFWDAGFLVANSAELQGVLHHFVVICHGEDFNAFWCKHGWTTWSWDGHCCGRGPGPSVLCTWFRCDPCKEQNPLKDEKSQLQEPCLKL